MNPKSIIASALLATASAAALAGGTNISLSVDGQISPGVYGRIDIGNATPPMLLYPQPVVITRPVRVVAPVQPVYLHVPPGHAKNWSKHCGRYNACGQPVYFVKSAEYEPGYANRDNGRGDHGDGHGKGHGKGHGNKH